MNNQIDISNFDLYGRSVLERIFNKSNKDDSIVRDIAVKVGYEIIEGIFLIIELVLVRLKTLPSIFLIVNDGYTE